LPAAITTKLLPPLPLPGCHLLCRHAAVTAKLLPPQPPPCFCLRRCRASASAAAAALPPSCLRRRRRRRVCFYCHCCCCHPHRFHRRCGQCFQLIVDCAAAADAALMPSCRRPRQAGHRQNADAAAATDVRLPPPLQCCCQRSAAALPPMRMCCQCRPHTARHHCAAAAWLPPR
jgi:hypothetical protein